MDQNHTDLEPEELAYALDQLDNTIKWESRNGIRPDFAIALEHTEAASKISPERTRKFGNGKLVFHQSPYGTTVVFETGVAFE